MKKIIIWLTDYFKNHFFQSRSHQNNWKKAAKIKMKLKGFEIEFRSARTITYLRKINPYVFEELILMSIMQAGYKITRNTRYTGDGGIDGCFFIDGKKVLIQAKRYSLHIDKSHVEEFSNQIRKHNAIGGLFVHTGRTGEGAYNVSGQTPVNFVSGQALVDLIIENKIDSNRLRFYKHEKELKKYGQFANQ